MLGILSPSPILALVFAPPRPQTVVKEAFGSFSESLIYKYLHQHRFLKRKLKALLNLKALSLTEYRRSLIHNRPPFCLAFTLMLISGTVELNPGPVYKFPCGFCSKPVNRIKWEFSVIHAMCGILLDVWTCLLRYTMDLTARMYLGYAVLAAIRNFRLRCFCQHRSCHAAIYLVHYMSLLLIFQGSLFFSDSLSEYNSRTSIPLATLTPLQAASDLPQPPSLVFYHRSYWQPDPKRTFSQDPHIQY